MPNFERKYSEEAIARVARLDKVIIRHPALDAAILGIQHAIQESSHFREPVGCMLLAEGGMGKTTVCKTIMVNYPVTVEIDVDVEVTRVPTFYTEVPAPATVKALAANMLAKLNDPKPLLGNVANMTQRLCTLLKSCGTKIIFLDEFHNLLKIEKRSTHVNEIVCSWIRGLVNETGVTICLVGTLSCASIIDADTQLARRFKWKFRLDGLKPSHGELFGYLPPFLDQLCKQALSRVVLAAMPQLNSQLNSIRMYVATQGNPSFIMALTKEAILIAISEGRNHVEIDDFGYAYDTGITLSVSLSRENPFRLSESQLARVFRK